MIETEYDYVAGVAMSTPRGWAVMRDGRQRVMFDGFFAPIMPEARWTTDVVTGDLLKLYAYNRSVTLANDPELYITIRKTTFGRMEIGLALYEPKLSLAFLLAGARGRGGEMVYNHAGRRMYRPNLEDDDPTRMPAPLPEECPPDATADEKTAAPLTGREAA